MPGTFRPHVLVVDDEPVIREALAAALGDRHVVHVAATGAEACAQLRARPIAAIILDALLGEERGLDLVPQFRRISSAPILVLTGHSSEALAVQAVWANVDGYLMKPVTLSALNDAIRRLVPQTDSGADLAVRARQYLEGHLADPLSTADLAARLAVSEIHLRRCFCAAHGKTPRRYLTDLRMDRAAQLLTTTAAAVETIAREVGYPCITTFGRVFRHAFEMTPSEYRSLRQSPGRPARPRGETSDAECDDG